SDTGRRVREEDCLRPTYQRRRRAPFAWSRQPSILLRGADRAPRAPNSWPTQSLFSRRDSLLPSEPTRCLPLTPYGRQAVDEPNLRHHRRVREPAQPCEIVPETLAAAQESHIRCTSAGNCHDSCECGYSAHPESADRSPTLPGKANGRADHV